MDRKDELTAVVRFVRRSNQKYIRIRVKPDEVIVSGPSRASERELKNFFEQKKEWVIENLQKLNQRKEQTGALNRFDEGFLLYGGEWVPVDITKNEPRTRITFENGRFKINVSKYEKPDAALFSWIYSNWAVSEIGKRFSETAAKYNFKVGRVTIRNQRTKWGSCSGKGNINLNWRLIKCPRFVQDYIFIHELCHLRHLNHSPEYWALVDSLYPRRAEAERWLKTHGPLAFQDP